MTKNRIDRAAREGAVRKKSWKGREQGAIANPVIKPKSSGVATPKLHGGDGAIMGELVVYEPCKEAVRPVTENIWVHPLHPNFPGRGARGEELVHKFHEQTVILTFKILDPEAPFDKWVADTVPRHQALSPGAAILACPKEGATPAI